MTATRSRLYFASDFHLGVPGHSASMEREKRICRWLDMVKADAAEIYLMGDIFDFWYEYATVVPRGYVRLLGKLAELTDAGIKITAFKGNHDMWQFGYLEKELNIPVISNELVLERDGKTLFLHHGDGLGPGDSGYKFIKRVFRNPVCQWLFGRLHPNFGIRLANWLSSRSRISKDGSEDHYLGDDKEFLTQYCNTVLKSRHYDYFIFGHRHLPLDITLQNGTSHYINLGEWVHYNTYAVFDGETVKLKTFEG